MDLLWPWPELALLLDLCLETFLNETSTVLFVAAALVSAWQGGFRPALLTIVAVNLCNLFLSRDPHFSLALGVNGPERLAVFTLVSILVAWLMARRKRAEASLKKLNQELEQRVNARAALEGIQSAARSGLLHARS